MKIKIIFFLVYLFSLLLTSCQNEQDSVYQLSKNEKIKLKSVVEKLDNSKIEFYLEMMKELSDKTMSLNNPELVRSLDSYKKIFTWVVEDVNNYPLLFQYILYDENNNGEIKSNCTLLLWDLSDEFFPRITEKMRNNNDYNSIKLIQLLLQNY